MDWVPGGPTGTGYGGGGVGGGGVGGGGAPGPSGNTGAGPAAPSPAQQINDLTAQITHLQTTNPLPGSPTAAYLAQLNGQLQALLKQQQTPAQPAQQQQSMFRPGSPTPMQKDSNRNLRDVAQNGAARGGAPMPGLARAAAQATNVSAGKTPAGGAIESPNIEGPSQKSLYSFVPSAENGQNPTGLDSNYLKFLQNVFTQNRQMESAPGAGAPAR